MASQLFERAPAGIPGLDEVSSEGFVPTRNYMVCGETGSGKTILSFHFLQQGVDESISELRGIQTDTPEVLEESSRESKRVDCDE